jgi:hypothetical protein
MTDIPRTTVTVTQHFGAQHTNFEQARDVHVNVEGARQFYLPDHVGDVVMTERGYAEVVEVTDHHCPGIDACDIEQIDLPVCPD